MVESPWSYHPQRDDRAKRRIKMVAGTVIAVSAVALAVDWVVVNPAREWSAAGTVGVFLVCLAIGAVGGFMALIMLAFAFLALAFVSGAVFEACLAVQAWLDGEPLLPPMVEEYEGGPRRRNWRAM